MTERMEQPEIRPDWRDEEGCLSNSLMFIKSVVLSFIYSSPFPVSSSSSQFDPFQET